MKLIGSFTSPFVRKVRIVLAEKKLDFEWQLDDVWSADPQVRAANPLGQVPCLIMEGGEAVFDSRVIVEYLDGLSPVGKLIPPNGRARIEVKTWEALADGVMEAAAQARLEAAWPGRQDHERSQAWIDRQLGKVHRSLEAMSRGLGSKQWCCETHLTLADIAVGTALGYLDFRFAHIDWRAQYPNLADLMARLMARPSFANTQPPV